MLRSLNRVRLAFPLAVMAIMLAGLLPTTVAAAPAGVSSLPLLNPANFNGGPINNPWFPLKPGTFWTYHGVKDGKHSSDIVHVTHHTKVIMGVRCVIVEDTLVFDGGWIGEKTRDFYAQDKFGTVWYLGENTAEYDRHGHVVSTEGTWQAGVSGAQAGIFMPAHPHVGDSFVQEFFPGHAEDHFKIVSLSASVSVPYGSFTGAMKTKEWTPLEPGVVDGKWYVKGIGNVLEKTIVGDFEVNRLVQVIKP